MVTLHGMAAKFACSIVAGIAIVVVGVCLINAGSWRAGIVILLPGLAVLRLFERLLVTVPQPARQLCIGAISASVCTALLYGLAWTISAVRRR